MFKRKRRAKVLKPEEREQRRLIEYRNILANRIHELRWLHSIPNGGLRHPLVAADMKAEGATAGVWDLFLPVSNRVWENGAVPPRYAGYYIEMKAIYDDGRKNYLTKEQKEFMEFIKNEGYMYSVCYTAEEAICHLVYYLRGKYPKHYGLHFEASDERKMKELIKGYE